MTWFDLYKMLCRGKFIAIFRSNGKPIPSACPPDTHRTKACYEDDACGKCWYREIPDGTEVILTFDKSSPLGYQVKYNINKED